MTDTPISSVTTPTATGSSTTPTTTRTTTASSRSGCMTTTATAGSTARCGTKTGRKNSSAELSITPCPIVVSVEAADRRPPDVRETIMRYLLLIYSEETTAAPDPA